MWFWKTTAQHIKEEHLRLQLKTAQYKLSAVQQCLAFNMRWREAMNRVVVDSRRATIALAQTAAAEGVDIKTVFALLIRSQPAQELLALENDLAKIGVYERMTPHQIIAIRASEDGLSKGLEHSGDAAVLTAQVEAAVARIEDLRADKQELWKSTGVKDQGILNTLSAQTHLQPTITRPEVYKGLCMECGVERTFKNDKCTMCGHLREV